MPKSIPDSQELSYFSFFFPGQDVDLQQSGGRTISIEDELNVRMCVLFKKKNVRIIVLRLLSFIDFCSIKIMVLRFFSDFYLPFLFANG